MRSLLGILALSAFAYGGMAFAQDKGKAAGPELPHCPVMGEDSISLNTHTSTPDGPVYFCCSECVEKYTKDPAKYADKVAAQRAALAKLPHVQVSDPVDGKPIAKSVMLTKGTDKVYFATEDNKKKYEATPDKYKGGLLASYSYQTTCPIMGEAIDPAAYVDLADGSRVYMCCKKCAGKLTGDPASYAKKLAAVGIVVDVDKLNAGAKKSEGKSEEKKPSKP